MVRMDKLLEVTNRIKTHMEAHYSLDMTRGKPSKEQLNLSLPMMDVLSSSSDYQSIEGLDVRNYGGLTGLKECKELMSLVLGVPSNNVIIFGNSSLNAMYDQISRSYTHGVCDSTPWSKLEKVKWICLTPGYDRHFAICEHFNMEMISVPLNNDGPDMDKIEELVKDPSIKGLWCVPKYSNPSGISYSNKVIKRLAALKPAAKDFRIYYDNAYALHGFSDDKDLLNIYLEAKKNNNEDIVYIFTSTSKISFPGSGIAALGCSDNNIKDIESHLKYQTISYDKVNQLRHVRYFKDYQGLKNHAHKHSEILKKKFDIVLNTLESNVKDYANWTTPKGGYFITLTVDHIAKEVVDTCSQCGLKLTKAGATHPYGVDPTNSFIRIAPSYLSLEELKVASNILCDAIIYETLKKNH